MVYLLLTTFLKDYKAAFERERVSADDSTGAENVFPKIKLSAAHSTQNAHWYTALRKKQKCRRK